VKIIGAVDIGGTRIRVGAVTETSAIVKRLECATTPKQGFATAMERIKNMLREVIGEGYQLEGIGIACPGPLNPFTGIIGDVGTLPGWEGGNLVAEFESEFGVQVAVENDADAGALAEANWGAAECKQRFIYVTVSTGIGGGIVLSGELYRGVGGAHPELGHQIIDPSGPLCYCNARGCWESLASGSAMVSWIKEQQPGIAVETAEEICALAGQDDPLAQRAVAREGYYLGLGLANLVTLFTPDAIALGGGVMKSGHLFLDHARKVVREVCTQVPAERTQIALASLGQDTGLAGAAQAWNSRYC
jgi:glucokinase